MRLWPWVMPLLAYFGVLGGMIGLGLGVQEIPTDWWGDIVAWGLIAAGVLFVFAPPSWWRKR